MVPFERALVTSYRPSILHSNFSSIFTCFRDIADFVLQHATFSYPTSIVSPKFSRVPLGVGGWPLGYEERRFGLIVRAISFLDFWPMWS